MLGFIESIILEISISLLRPNKLNLSGFKNLTGLIYLASKVEK